VIKIIRTPYICIIIASSASDSLQDEIVHDHRYTQSLINDIINPEYQGVAKQSKTDQNIIASNVPILQIIILRLPKSRKTYIAERNAKSLALPVGTLITDSIILRSPP